MRSQCLNKHSRQDKYLTRDRSLLDCKQNPQCEHQYTSQLEIPNVLEPIQTSEELVGHKALSDRADNVSEDNVTRI